MITEKDIKNATMHINDIDIYDYGVLLESFKVSGTQVINTIYQGLNRTNFNLLANERYMRDISVSLFFTAPTRRELSLKKSTIDNMLNGKVELSLPDDFIYSAYMESSGEEQILGVENNQVIALCAYTFKGIRHDPLETISDNTVICKSTVPRTDCRLTCTASQNRSRLVIGTVTITNVSKDDVLVVDGITGSILQNGTPCAGNMTFQNFPYLEPGLNIIDCVEDLTIEYYPTY